MDAFVADLTRLYHLATEATMGEFPRRALDLLRDWIEFDGAVFGFGEPATDEIRFDGVSIYNRDQALLSEYAEISRFDPVTKYFVHRPGVIQNVDTLERYTGKENHSLAQYSKCHELRHLLLVGDDTKEHNRLRWVVLYRGTRKPFDEQAVLRLSAAWQHVICALDLNRARELDLRTPPGTRRSLALVSRGGTFELVDHGFLALLKKEWKDLPDTRLPAEAVRALQDRRSFKGRHVEIGFSNRGDYLLCEARALEARARLTEREGQVAQYYATGCSYKEIAGLLGISPNTVRVHLAKVYQKLEINDKARLASALASRQEGGSSF